MSYNFRVWYELMRITKYVILSPQCTDILSCDISAMIYESKHSVGLRDLLWNHH